MPSYDKPILLLIFNRPATTARVFAALKELRPSKLYVAGDGPRPNTNDATLCQEARDLIQVDWPCELKTLYRTENMGCRHAVAEAISWVFKTEEQAVILEDDCLPHPSFFTYTSDLLDYYQDNEQVMHIGGNFFQPQAIGDGSYYFSHIPHIWGWATWRRAWARYDLAMSDWPSNKHLVNQITRNWYQRQKWTYILDKIYQDRRHAWDYQWLYCLLKNDSLAVTPNVNLVSNIGFMSGALHDASPDSKFANLAVSAAPGHLVHPRSLTVSQSADLFTSQNNFQFNPFKVIIRNLLVRFRLINL